MNDDIKKLSDTTLSELAAINKKEREAEHSGNTWNDWDDITFIDMVLSKMERAWRKVRRHDNEDTFPAAESLRDGYNYLLELKRRLKERV